MGLPAHLDPLTCQSCRAPVPLSEGDEVQCPSCGGRQALPPEYRLFRDARRITAEGAKKLEALAAELSKGPPPWKRVAVIVGYAVGITTLVVFAIGAIIGAFAGFMAAGELKAGNALGMVIVVICASVCGLVSVPLMGEAIVLGVQHWDVSRAYDLAVAMPQLHIDAGVGAGIYVFGVLPVALARTTQQDLKQLEALRRELAALPAVAGNTPGCRSCGAPLTVAPGATAARCAYCQTESLVRLSGAVALKHKTKARALHWSVLQAAEDADAARREERELAKKLVVGGVLIVPFVLIGGVVFRALAAA